MKKETVIGIIAEIGNNGEFSCGAIDLLRDELKETYSPVEITNILKVVKGCKNLLVGVDVTRICMSY